jgi:arsenite-transporting ATPase
MSRIILTAGKGGVGKSTFAAATGAAIARQGARVLVMSIDSAHNLSDIFEHPLGSAPTQVSESLFGLEVDLSHELRAHWGAVTDFFRSMTANDPRVSRLVAEECAVLPGMEEAFGLMRLQDLVDSGEWDVIVLDSPPTGDMLKFLRLPDVLRWFMEKYHPLERSLLQKLRPVAEVMNLPMPTEESMVEMEHWYSRVKDASATLTDGSRVSVRLVMTPEQVSLAETRRAFTWTCLMGLLVDGVLINRILPTADYPPQMAGWLERQRGIIEAATESFSAVPVLRAEQRFREVIGLAELESFAAETFSGRDPQALWVSEPPARWQESEEAAELLLRLPFLKKGAFRLLAAAEGLVLNVGNQRHIIPLPPSIQRRTMLGAKYEADWLRVRFGADTPNPAG